MGAEHSIFTLRPNSNRQTASSHSSTRVTEMKPISLVLFLALLSTALASSASASDLRRFEGAGAGAPRKLLSGLRGKTSAWKAAVAQEVREDRDYGPPGSNPPYHEDPPSPFTMTSVGELKNFETVVDIDTDYAPVNTHPPDYDYPPTSRWSSETGNIHTDYAPLRPDPVPDYHDYPPPGIWSSKTGNIHTDYAPLRPDPVPNNPPATIYFDTNN